MKTRGQGRKVGQKGQPVLRRETGRVGPDHAEAGAMAGNVTFGRILGSGGT